MNPYLKIAGMAAIVLLAGCGATTTYGSQRALSAATVDGACVLGYVPESGPASFEPGPPYDLAMVNVSVPASGSAVTVGSAVIVAYDASGRETGSATVSGSTLIEPGQSVNMPVSDESSLPPGSVTCSFAEWSSY